jgi:hypothetical protein
VEPSHTLTVDVDNPLIVKLGVAGGAHWLYEYPEIATFAAIKNKILLIQRNIENILTREAEYYYFRVPWHNIKKSFQ